MYKIKLSKQASRFIITLSKNDQKKINEKIKSLSDNPRKQGVIKLVNHNPEAYRVRQGNYRIKFHIYDGELIIDVIEVDHRKDVYR